MRLVIDLADGPGQQEALTTLLSWRSIRSAGEVVFIGEPGEQPIFAWRITGVEVTV